MTPTAASAHRSPAGLDIGGLEAAARAQLDPAAYEPERAVPLLVAGWLALVSLPLFFLCPDARRTGASARSAFAGAPRLFWTMLRGLRGDRDAANYLLARMLFADGQGGLIMFGGIYAAGVLGYATVDLLVYGVLLSVFAAIGAHKGVVSPGTAVTAIGLYLVLSVVALAIDRRALMAAALFYLLAAVISLLASKQPFTTTVALTGLVVGPALLLLSAFWGSARRAVLAVLPGWVTSRLPPLPADRAATPPTAAAA